MTFDRLKKLIERNKREEMKLYFNIEKTFNSEMKEMVKDFDIDSGMPKIFKDLNLDPGIYSWGVASTEDVDTEGEKVIISDRVISDLTKAPYNKVFMSHDSRDIASGIIKFAGRMEAMDNQFIILEQINESHPKFKNIVGSIANNALDAYSVSGEATVEVDFDKATNKQVKIRKVNVLREVSRTSFPANPEAGIEGLFFVKTKNGGYAIEEDPEMEKDIIKALEGFKESLDNLTGRMDNIEKFKKDLEEADKKEPVKKDPVDPVEPTKPTEPTEPKDDPVKPTDPVEPITEEKVEKMIKTRVDKEVNDFKKSLKDPGKGIAKDDTNKFKKTKKDDQLMGFLKDPSRKDLNRY